jgi:hypothetical protein
MKNIIIALVIVSLGINMYIPFFIKERNHIINKKNTDLKITNDSLLITIDSLKGEIFTKDIDLGRYEYMLDRAEDEMSPDCRKQLEKIYGETE